MSADPTDRLQKYGLGLLTAGLPVDNALAPFRSACNKHDTLFITPSGFNRREESLRALLSDPITTDQAAALRQAVLEHAHIDEVLLWLKNGETPWADFLASSDASRPS